MRTPFVLPTGGAPLLVRLSVVLAVSFGMLAATTAPASAAEATVALGTAGSYAVLGASTVTNTGPSVLTGDVGLSPGTAVVGFPPGTVVGGTIHSTDAAAAQAQADATIAYDDAAGRSSSATVVDLAGLVLSPGVYTAVTSLTLTGTVTLDAHGDADAVFVLRAGTSLTTASASAVALVNGASPCRVFWQIGSSATLGTASTLQGTVLAMQSITATTGAEVDGRLLARNGAVTLDTNRIAVPSCAASTTATSMPAGADTTTAAATASTATASASDPTLVAGPPSGTTAAATPAAPSRPAGATSTATSRPAAPPLPATGMRPLLALVAVALLLVGAGLSWAGRIPLAHARRSG
jgi:hypothetical protein